GRQGEIYPTNAKFRSEIVLSELSYPPRFATPCQAKRWTVENAVEKLTPSNQQSAKRVALASRCIGPTLAAIHGPPSRHADGFPHDRLHPLRQKSVFRDQRRQPVHLGGVAGVFVAVRDLSILCLSA